MAFPASQMRLGPTLDQVSGVLNSLKSYAQTKRAAMLAGNVGSNLVIDVWEHLKQVKTNLQALSSVPGLAAYAQDQYGNESLNIATEFTAVLNAIDGVTANIQSTHPADGSAYLLAAQFGASAITYRQFTPAQTATLAGLLNTLAGTIS